MVLAVTFMIAPTGGQYIGLSRDLAEIAHRAHNARVPADTQADACACANCNPFSARALPRAPEAGPADALSPLLPAGPASLADAIERDIQDRLREQSEGERCPICDWPLAASADQGCSSGNCSYHRIQARRRALHPLRRGPVQDESGRLDPLDAAAMRAIEGAPPMPPPSEREIGA